VGARIPIGTAIKGCGVRIIRSGLGLLEEDSQNQIMNTQDITMGAAAAPRPYTVSAVLAGLERTGKIFFTVQEAAEILGVAPGWLYERTRRKAIPHRKLGKYVRFTAEDLTATSDAAATGTLQ
jgi:excisionase family DNA binding protein